MFIAIKAKVTPVLNVNVCFTPNQESELEKMILLCRNYTIFIFKKLKISVVAQITRGRSVTFMSNLIGTLINLEKAFNQGLWTTSYFQFGGKLIQKRNI